MKTKNGVILVLCGVFIGCLIALTGSNADPEPVQKAPDISRHPGEAEPSSPVAKTADFDGYERNNIEIFERASSSVVFVSTRSLRRSAFSLNIFEIPQGAGTGFVWDKTGHIVTNFHVIASGNRWVVRLIDQNEYPAELVGVAEDKDLAVLKIDAPSELLQPVELPGNNRLVVGQKALAIGNPFGLDHTLTVGVISALEREIESPYSGRRISGVIQTDAAINPGNSGGPLLNSTGKIIGVNTQIVSRSGSNAGIGFAIPIYTVRKVVPELIQYGKVRRAGIGIEVLNDEYKGRLGIRSGVVIHRVNPGSEASRLGLRGLQASHFGRVILGDVIVGVNEKSIDNIDDLSETFERHKAGETVTLQILRGNRLLEFKAELEIVND